MLIMHAWERDHVPMPAPQISLDILLFAASRDGSNGDVQVKNFHLALNHSEDRVREIIKQLVADEWLRFEVHNEDGRVKLVRPTEKLLIMLGEYERSLREILNEAS